ncbi:hypothetical protein FB451DRAFT_1066661 [Mycena latifolia]|nr:hypothetical protein FB451DRAFT_1066661 [Mycena latifolia]
MVSPPNHVGHSKRWSILDKDAPQVAGEVYAHLFKTSPQDSTRAAEALHLAVRKLRDSD